MRTEAILHVGSYGCATTKQQQDRTKGHRGDRAGLPWHASMKAKEVADLYVNVGFVGRRQQETP